MTASSEHSYKSPLDNLSYFVEWGPNGWERLTRYALRNFVGEKNLSGKKVLEIGCRYGKMTSLFALLGAKVTGLDTNNESLKLAKDEAKKWNVADRVEFISYDGDLDVIPDESFDLIFTKSVLVVIPELEKFLEKLSRKLKSDGQIIFIENARGWGIVHWLRNLKHRSWNFRVAHYFVKEDLSVFDSKFEIEEIKRSHLPPIYMLLGKKRSSSQSIHLS